jgi:cytochrome P450
MTPSSQKPSFASIFTPEIIANPYPWFDKLRSTQPVYFVESMGGWLLTRYDDVAAAFRHPKLSSAGRNEMLKRKVSDPAMRAALQSEAMVFTDPPAHTRMRTLINKAFTPRAVDQMADRIRRAVDDFLTSAEPRGSLDVIHDLAFPLPMLVISEMLGVPHEDRTQVKHWCDGMAQLVNAVGGLSEDQVRAGVATRREFVEYFRGLVNARRKQPRQDLLTALMQAEEAGDRLSEAELFSNCLMLIFAGHETTTNLIGNATLALLQHPQQLQALRSNPALMANAIEESLRYESPAQATMRTAIEDVPLGGKTIGKGQPVWLLVGAANRDPAQFPNPDRFDITRKEIKHLAFGAGIHFCLGAPLARLEGQIALAAMLKRFANLRLGTDKFDYLDNFTFRGVKALPVKF